MDLQLYYLDFIVRTFSFNFPHIVTLLLKSKTVTTSKIKTDKRFVWEFLDNHKNIDFALDKTLKNI